MTTVFDLGFSILFMAGCWRMFEKAGLPGWNGIIPFYNIYKLFKICWGNEMCFFLLFIPGINIFVWVFLCIYIAGSYGKTGLYALGLMIIPVAPVFFAMIGLGSAEYCGPRGIGGASYSGPNGFGGRQGTSDTVDFNVENGDVGSDKENARTVDFDVERNN